MFETKLVIDRFSKALLAAQVFWLALVRPSYELQQERKYPRAKSGPDSVICGLEGSRETYYDFVDLPHSFCCLLRRPRLETAPIHRNRSKHTLVEPCACSVR